ncbi:hypothetical protein ETAA8_61580 [Anatilimnocola aggregata]|uniref:DUF4345 domain-containing protein n=1 Tax=Anatilimnocola aggregata TaxID=2528021 RepID=A0A517YL98_9BACT|nr:DUF4345 family protein [Anatilimnocola aggregata]QDU31005.1 hypothetical protein ETAA8_61580 [Anatilimnocola aggregata]
MNDQLITRGFLALVGVAYIILGVWCTVSPQQTANSIGYSFRNGSGMSEYITVYGGLELGMGLFFLWPLLRHEQSLAVLMACLLVHGCIVLFRVPTLLTVSGVERMTYYLFTTEFTILLISAWRMAVTRSA